MELTTTLKNCKEFKGCKSGLDKLKAHLGEDFGESQSIPLSTILESNGLSNTVWALRCTEQDSKELIKYLSVRLAQIVLPVWARYNSENKSVKNVINITKLYLIGKASLAKVCNSASAADYIAASAYADSAAAYAAVSSAADAATYAAYVIDAYASDAAYYAIRAAAADLDLKQKLEDEILKAVTKPKEYIKKLKKEWRNELF